MSTSRPWAPATARKVRTGRTPSNAISIVERAWRADWPPHRPCRPAGVGRGDASTTIDQKGVGHVLDAVLLGGRIVAEHDSVGHAGRLEEWRTTFQPSSSSETPTTVRPWDAYLRWNSENQGISSLHPWHQVAQKSSRTTLPRYFFRVTVLPERSFSANSGAGLRSTAGWRTARTVDGSAAAAIPASVRSRAAACTAFPRQRRRMARAGRYTIGQ